MSDVEKNAAKEVKAPVAKIDAAAEKAYADAAAKSAVAKAPAAPKPVPAPVAEKPAVVVPAAKPLKAAPATKTPVAAAPAAPIVAAPKKAVAAKKAVKVRKAVAKTVTKAASKLPVTKPVPAARAQTPAAATKPNPVTKIKDTIMATLPNTDFTAAAKDVFADVQIRAKTAYAKTTELATEATEFSKANVEAVVESSKIFIAGAQDLVKDNIETGKTVIETMTEDAKKMAAVKSPTELMQLQGELARRNFDALVSYGSKRTEAWVKLYNDAFAPITNRVSVAAEKLGKAA